MTDRKSELAWLLSVLHESIEESPPDKRAPLAAQMRAVLEELDSLGAPEEVERTGLLDFQEALESRRKSAAN